MDELTHTDQEAPDGTGYNDFPVGFRPLTEKEVAQSKFFSYRPEFIETRQALPSRSGRKDFSKMVELTIFWYFDKTGIAISHDFWAGKVLYFACGCDHKYRELSTDECRKRGITHYGMCYHVSECTECGHILSVDSSG